ncbi:MAG: SapC family protein [Thermodesulfobacteria bacterium]|nr:SapC family protein [Thermodesulfobacteriota bacterium]
MEFLHSGFKEPIVLDSENLKNQRVRLPQDYSFAKKVEFIPLCFDEIIAVSLYYPVIFGVVEGTVIPYAILGINKKNVFVSENGDWKTDIIPELIKIYPFGFVKEGEDYVVFIDKTMCSEEEGELLFNELGEETEFLKEKKKELTKVAKGLHTSLNFCEEIVKLGLLTSVNLEVNTAIGNFRIKNMLTLNLNKFNSISPEKLWFLSNKGYIVTLIAHYLSLRNFKLMELWALKP